MCVYVPCPSFPRQNERCTCEACCQIEHVGMSPLLRLFLALCSERGSRFKRKNGKANGCSFKSIALDDRNEDKSALATVSLLLCCAIFITKYTQTHEHTSPKRCIGMPEAKQLSRTAQDKQNGPSENDSDG